MYVLPSSLFPLLLQIISVFSETTAKLNEQTYQHSQQRPQLLLLLLLLLRRRWS